MFFRPVWTVVLVIGALVVPVARGGGQASPPVNSLAPTTRKPPSKGDVPADQMPPAGMCRVWLENVPPAQQPAPTDCPSAIRNRPPNGRVIFPEDGARDRRDEKGEGRNKKESKPRKPTE